MKILNLYCGIGGNRKLWGDNHEITAVEYDESIAAIYKDLFPNDIVIVGDAHQYLLEHYTEFDFIWSSPPCPTHSKFRFMTTKMSNVKYSRPVIYPDMSLYAEIILIQNYFNGTYCIENVKSYYKPLIKPQESGRHYFWANFSIENVKSENKNFIKETSSKLKKLHGFNIDKYKTKKRKDQILRNCLSPEIGLAILQSAENIYNHNQMKREGLFKDLKP